MNQYGECPECHEKFYYENQIKEHICITSGTIYNIDNMPKQEIDLEEIRQLGQSITENYMMELAKIFMGVPIRLDLDLKGNEYYICVSRDMLAEIERQATNHG